MSTKALGPFVIGQGGFNVGAFFVIDNPWQGQARNKWKALVRNNTVYDLMISASDYTTWLGPDEQDYYEFPEGVQSFAMIPVVTTPIPGSIFEGDVKVTAFDQSSEYDGQFPTPLAPQVVLYESGPSQELGSFAVAATDTVSQTFPVDSFVHTIVVLLDVGGSVDAQGTLIVTGSSGFVYFDGLLNFDSNAGCVFLTVPWIYVHDPGVTVEFINQTGQDATIAVIELADIYPTLNVNGVPYVLVPRGSTFRDTIASTGTPLNLGSISGVRGVKIQAFAANEHVITYGYTSGDSQTEGDELSPGQAHVLPIQNANAIWIDGTAGDGVTLQGV